MIMNWKACCTAVVAALSCLELLALQDLIIWMSLRTFCSSLQKSFFKVIYVHNRGRWKNEGRAQGGVRALGKSQITMVLLCWVWRSPSITAAACCCLSPPFGPLIFPPELYEQWEEGATPQTTVERSLTANVWKMTVLPHRRQRCKLTPLIFVF